MIVRMLFGQLAARADVTNVLGVMVLHEAFFDDGESTAVHAVGRRGLDVDGVGSLVRGEVVDETGDGSVPDTSALSELNIVAVGVIVIEVHENTITSLHVRDILNSG